MKKQIDILEILHEHPEILYGIVLTIKQYCTIFLGAHAIPTTIAYMIPHYTKIRSKEMVS